MQNRAGSSNPEDLGGPEANNKILSSTFLFFATLLLS
jgi:hypothetical protein